MVTPHRWEICTPPLETIILTSPKQFPRQKPGGVILSSSGRGTGEFSASLETKANKAILFSFFLPCNLQLSPP